MLGTGEPLAKRMRKIMAIDTFADVHFLVGKDDEREKVFAHKIIMASSDVFEKMFRFDAANSNVGSADNPVVIDDIEADVFKVMLSFIYADDLSGLNGDNTMEVLYAARKYNISFLVNKCLDFPIGELQNVFISYDRSRLIDENIFSRRCLDYIDRNAEALLKSDAFLQIGQNLLCEIFERDQLKIYGGELTIWNAALRWADEKCRQNGEECSAENRRVVLGPALFKIRFPLITKEDFSTEIVPSGMLSKDEMLGLFMYFCHPNFCHSPKLYPLRFSTQKRIEGILTMEIENLSEFAQENTNSCRYSQNDTYIGGIPWKIMADFEKSEDSTENCLAIFLSCTTSKEDPNWSCGCWSTFRIVSQNSGTEDFTRKSDTKDIFNSQNTSWGYPNFITFQDLMNLDKGFYNKAEDKVTLAIEIFDVVYLT